MSKHRISYFYDEEIGNFYYDEGHPMKPIRVRMTHELVLAYGLHEHLEIFRPRHATPQEMMKFHSLDYINFLRTTNPHNVSSHPVSELKRFNIGDDCPIFENIFEYCQISAGGSICAAQRLNSGLCHIAINWAGGLHHAAKDHPSGFCYIADCVLGIIELLKYHPRVMYIDIDIHHGDGVEEAFYNSDRVLTCSFHKFSRDFFPGTGHIYDVGIDVGKYYAVNVPLQDGITDSAYEKIFKPIIKHLIEWFRPGAILLQCGADSLVGDRLGFFNLSTKGHGECVSYVKSFGIPLLVCGGGGYTKESVARCWAYETSLLCGVDVGNNLPETDYSPFLVKQCPNLHLTPDPRMRNKNSDEYLDGIYKIIVENLRHLPGAPSVQMQELPPRAAVLKPQKVSTAPKKFSELLCQKLNLNDENDDEEEEEYV
ncbi:acetylpolyamine aminohydrolase, putative [Trichomonas vaginalis G3]|uniref:Histone deacetylase n=1 Tax=Trichomonas vaginalis (strain ATCC PRA-98 / G3) TaxID=412133 RepID=A2DIM8_TRIV3|nr:histone deacetylase class I, eukaryotic type family [Trichomonas vaginalis G3]EAY19832.1 acetylpolyamine aminohydrolase, putative [Trichomonas vaginalis G3]KAI5524035.1 histone deacetylase class I, eukaryotic type family [Trichomonas vaginalis G3]|eukprot:XP_001580818.1 acetylpolyamine aminohydrolase [Trichomonas vaginalis G3]